MPRKKRNKKSPKNFSKSAVNADVTKTLVPTNNLDSYGINIYDEYNIDRNLFNYTDTPNMLLAVELELRIKNERKGGAGKPTTKKARIASKRNGGMDFPLEAYVHENSGNSNPPSQISGTLFDGVLVDHDVIFNDAKPLNYPKSSRAITDSDSLLLTQKPKQRCKTNRRTRKVMLEVKPKYNPDKPIKE